MTRLGALLIALIVALLASVLLAGGGQAQDGPQVQDTAIRIDEFPSSVTFTALIADGAQAAEVVFFYTILPEGALTRQPAEVMRGDVTRASAVVETSGADIYIPVGADIEWFWELTSNDGTVIETEREIWRYEDPRYEWDELSRGDVVVRYYDSESVAAELAVEGLNAVEEMTALLGITVDFPLKVYVWRSEADAQGVQRVRSEGFDEQVITGGVRVLADLVHIYQPDAWVIRHELTHVLTKIAGESALGDLPSWLDEGTATISEGDWQRRRGGALQRAIDNDVVLPVRGMASNSNIPGQVDIFYGQSASLVTFLIDSYGADQFAALFAEMKSGSTIENALTAVYGFGRDGLDDAWRASVGLAPRVRGEDRSTVIEDEVIAGPEVAEPEEAAEPQQAQSEPAGESETAESGGAEAAGELETAEADDRRSAEEIAARTAEIERRQSERRAGPSFSVSGGFPWDYVVVAAAGAALLLSAGLLIRVISPRGRDAGGS